MLGVYNTASCPSPALLHSRSRMTSDLSSRHQTIKDRSEMTTILINCSFFPPFQNRIPQKCICRLGTWEASCTCTIFCLKI